MKVSDTNRYAYNARGAIAKAEKGVILAYEATREKVTRGSTSPMMEQARGNTGACDGCR